MNFELIDNFLPPNEFEEIQDYFTGQDFPWYVNQAKVMHVARMVDPELQAKEIYNWQMVNYVYGGGQPLGPQYEKVLPIINRLQPRALIRIKANLNHHTDKLQEYDFHTDCGEYGSNEFEGATTAIYYLNDNNGYTYFQDGTKVDSKANRLLQFKVNTPHAGTSCTDQKFRVVLNFNYF
jgi:hypothetical protein|tara:strand:+ start:3186 stop:3722 length:537 start_codon:yes stop_codon:yes gene_type:complete